eukprot:264513-Lingulodinium_polyedra.AAC.1
MKNIAGAYGIAMNYSTGGAAKNPFTMLAHELVDSSVRTDIFGTPLGEAWKNKLERDVLCGWNQQLQCL